jgi:VanZ family protein
MYFPPTGNIYTSISVTAFVVLFVTLFPMVDLAVCKRVGFSPVQGMGLNDRDDHYLRLRRFALYLVFLAYLAAVGYLVFFSRTAAEDFRVHAVAFQDLSNAITIDLGILGFIEALVQEGPAGVLSHIKVHSIDGVAQVYLNVMLFVPMGYLLPYVFRWFRAKARIRPALASFLASLFIENVQLVTKLGFYDVDDLIANTLGGIIGQWLFILFAYALTNPTWLKDLMSYHKWAWRARNTILYPFARKIDLSRTTIQATGEDDIWEFYVKTLGFRRVGQIVPLDSEGTTLLLQLGTEQIEFVCTNAPRDLGDQMLNITAIDLPRIRQRLVQKGIEVGPIEPDLFRGMLRMSFMGPDNVRINILESYVD